MFSITKTRAESRQSKGAVSKSAVVLLAAMTCAAGVDLGGATAHAASARHFCLEAATGGCSDAPATAVPKAIASPSTPRAIAIDATLTKNTLKITGAHFKPNSMVRLSVIDTSDWDVIWSGSVRVQPAVFGPVTGRNGDLVRPANPAAGTFTRTVKLGETYGTSGLIVMYRVAKRIGTHSVKVL